jgi:hypothetical protein
LWEVGRNSEAKPQRQIVLIGPRGGVEVIRLGREPCGFFPNVPELLRQRRDAGFKVERFFGDSEEDLRRIDKLCSEVFGRKPVAFQVGEPGQIIRAYSAFQLSPTYFRAIAKIGFHAFLFFYPNLTGFEPEFDTIKRFIYKGDEPNRYVYASPDPIIRRPDPITPMHEIACDWNQHVLEARLQLFAGLENRMHVVAGAPGGGQITTRQGDLVLVVRLGPNPSRLVFEDRRGAVFSYYEAPDGDGYHGEMTELRGFGKALPIAILLGRAATFTKPIFARTGIAAPKADKK